MKYKNYEQNRKEALNRIVNLRIKHTNLCFIHIPKNGGRSVLHQFIDPINRPVNRNNDGVVHLNSRQINEIEEYSNLQFFTFSRNPYARLLSCFNWMRKPNKVFNEHLLTYGNFESFILDLPNLQIEDNIFTPYFRETNDNVVSYHFNKQVNWINERLVFKGKMENMTEDLNKFSEEFGVGTKTSIRNISSFSDANRKYKSFYTKEMYRIVNSLYEEDFHFFNYRFEE